MENDLLRLKAANDMSNLEQRQDDLEEGVRREIINTQLKAAIGVGKLSAVEINNICLLQNELDIQLKFIEAPKVLDDEELSKEEEKFESFKMSIANILASTESVVTRFNIKKREFLEHGTSFLQKRCSILGLRKLMLAKDYNNLFNGFAGLEAFIASLEKGDIFDLDEIEKWNKWIDSIFDYIMALRDEKRRAQEIEGKETQERCFKKRMTVKSHERGCDESLGEWGDFLRIHDVVCNQLTSEFSSEKRRKILDEISINQRDELKDIFEQLDRMKVQLEEIKETSYIDSALLTEIDFKSSDIIKTLNNHSVKRRTYRIRLRA